MFDWKLHKIQSEVLRGGVLTENMMHATLSMERNYNFVKLLLILHFFFQLLFLINKQDFGNQWYEIMDICSETVSLRANWSVLHQRTFLQETFATTQDFEKLSWGNIWSIFKGKEIMPQKLRFMMLIHFLLNLSDGNVQNCSRIWK